MTLKSVILTIEARAEALSTQRQDDWDRARWMAAISLQPHMSKGKTLKPQDLITFPWEIRPTAAAPVDKAAEEAARRELFAKWDAEMKSQWQ